MGAEIHLPIGQALQPGRCLQLPVLPARLHLAAGQASAPVALVELTVQAQVELELRPIEGQVQLLLANVALAFGSQGAQVGFAQADRPGLQVDQGTLGAVQPGVQVKALHAVFGLAQLLALQGQLPLRRLERTGHIEPALELALQLRPQLAQARQVEVKLTGQALLHTGAAVDLVVPQLDQQGAQGPVLACTVGLGLQHGGLAAQSPLEVQIGIQAQRVALEFALAAQRARQGARQLGQPVRRVERRQFQCRVPRHALGKLHGDAAGHLALAGFKGQLWQADLAQVALERAADLEGTCRPVQVATEIALVVAVAVVDLGVQAPQRDLRSLVQRVQAQPREVQPVDAGIGNQTALPVGSGAERDTLLRGGAQVQGGDLGALGIHPATQAQADRPLLGRQAAGAHQLVTFCQVAIGTEFQLLELQGVRQSGRWLEAGGAQAYLGRQVLGQGPQLTRQAPLQVAAAVGLQVEAFLQVAFYLHRQLPGLVVDGRQLHLTLQLQRPVTHRLQQAAEVQAEVFALQVQAVDLQALGGPVCSQLQLAQLLAAVQMQLADLYFAQFDRHWQLEAGQLQRPAVGRCLAGGEVQVDLPGAQLVDAQGHAQQAAGRPGKHRCKHFDPVLALLPDQPIGLPLPAKAALKIVQLQARHQAQGPAAAGLGTQQDTHGQHQHDQQRQQGQPAAFQHLAHNSGPMEKCKRMPPSSSSALARSSRSGPTGDTQRTPKPTPVLRLGSSRLLNELPWSTKVARRHFSAIEYWYSALAATR